MGAMQLAPFGKDQWQNQGSFITWNYPSGTGNMALFSASGAAAGGFNFYTVPSSPAATPVLLGSITPTVTTFGRGAGSGVVQVAIDGDAGQLRILQFRSHGLGRWSVFADSTTEPLGGANAGSNLNIASLDDGGTVTTTVMSINRATGTISLKLPVNAANDAAAATAGVPVGGVYRNASALMIRVA